MLTGDSSARKMEPILAIGHRHIAPVADDQVDSGASTHANGSCHVYGGLSIGPGARRGKRHRIDCGHTMKRIAHAAVTARFGATRNGEWCGGIARRFRRFYTAGMLKAIVFDFDGVIVDSEPAHFRAFAEAAKSIHYEFDYQHYLGAFVGFDDRDAFRAMLRDRGHPPDERQIAQLCRLKHAAFERLVGKAVSAIPGAVPLIQESHGQLPLAIASGATMLDIELILGGLNLRDRFQIIVSADHVGRSKPDPQTYVRAVEQLAARHGELALSPCDCLAIEDTSIGIDSARAAGLLTLAVATTAPAARLRTAHRVEPSLEGVTLARLREWFGTQ